MEEQVTNVQIFNALVTLLVIVGLGAAPPLLVWMGKKDGERSLYVLAAVTGFIIYGLWIALALDFYALYTKGAA